MDLTPVFAQTQAQKKYSHEGQCFKEDPLLVQMEPCQLLQHQGELPAGDAPPTLRSVSIGTVQEMSEILMFADIYW